MIERFLKWIIKKYLLKTINKMLQKNKEGVDEFSPFVALWSFRFQNLLNLLADINIKIADGNLSETEYEDALKQVEIFLKEW